MSDLQKQARALGDPTRHRIFRYVAEAAEPVGVAELTAHFGLNHNAIRQHLAKLTDAGLVTETAVRGGGPGRPRLVYTVSPAAESRWGVTGPYERLAALLTEVVATGDSPREVGRRAGRRYVEQGRSGDTVVDGVVAAMAREGFEPELDRTADRAAIVLRNCPFETAALVDPATICSLHLGLAEGLTEGDGSVDVEELVANDPRRADCVLRLRSDQDG